jgi:Na+/H+ antiporter NhaD/arsenite permease-like protein
MPASSPPRPSSRLAAAAAALLALLPSPALAAADAAHLDGAQLSALWAIPFVGLLLSIAILPLAAPFLWHHHYGKITAAWALAFLVPCALGFGLPLTFAAILHAALLEYVPFLILLFALFTVAGGVYLAGNLHGTAALNTGFLAVGTLIASIAGTTGAAMLLIRPLIRANDARLHNAHVVIFFIFLVANIGGSLTPLGDPPLFLGFLKGVDFFWPTTHLLAPTALVAALLLAAFFVLDSYLFRIDKDYPPKPDPTPDDELRIHGWFNGWLLGGVMLAVLVSGMWKPGLSATVHHVTVELQNVVRDVLLLAIAWASWRYTNREYRIQNGFAWAPIAEVAKLFAGIFVTIIPVIAILRAGTAGAFGPLVRLVTDAHGQPIEAVYFWLTGGLSGFLDNAPTYLVFFNMAGGDPVALMGRYAATLTAISAGAVFMGALTYIGNAPNFMVKAIAEDRGVKMPSFFGYMLWSIGCLVPCFLLVTLVFFR